MNRNGFLKMSPPSTPYLLLVPVYMTHLLSANCYISTSKLSLFFTSNIVFCHSQVTNMEIGAVPLWVRSQIFSFAFMWEVGIVRYDDPRN